MVLWAKGNYGAASNIQSSKPKLLKCCLDEAQISSEAGGMAAYKQTTH